MVIRMTSFSITVAQGSYVSCGKGAVDVFEHSDGALRRVAADQDPVWRRALLSSCPSWTAYSSRRARHRSAMDAKIMVFARCRSLAAGCCSRTLL